MRVPRYLYFLPVAVGLGGVTLYTTCDSDVNRPQPDQGLKRESDIDKWGHKWRGQHPINQIPHFAPPEFFLTLKAAAPDVEKAYRAFLDKARKDIGEDRSPVIPPDSVLFGRVDNRRHKIATKILLPSTVGVTPFSKTQALPAQGFILADNNNDYHLVVGRVFSRDSLQGETINFQFPNGNSCDSTLFDLGNGRGLWSKDFGIAVIPLPGIYTQQPDGKEQAALRFRDFRMPELQGERVMSICNPFGSLPCTLTHGTISSAFKHGYVGEEQTPLKITQYSMHVGADKVGGSPLVDINGELIGMWTWQRKGPNRDITFGPSLLELKKMFDSGGIPVMNQEEQTFLQSNPLP